MADVNLGEVVKIVLQVQRFTSVMAQKQMDQLADRIQAVVDGNHKHGKIVLTVREGRIEMVSAEEHDEK